MKTALVILLVCAVFHQALVAVAQAGKLPVRFEERIASASEKFGRLLEIVHRRYLHSDKTDLYSIVISGFSGLEEMVPDLIVTANRSTRGLKFELCSSSQVYPFPRIASRKAVLDYFAVAIRHIALNSCYRERILSGETIFFDRFYESMLRSIDPHSKYLNRENHQEFQIRTRGKFGGIGIVLGFSQGHLTIRKVYPDTPAEDNGLKEGDEIVSIDSTLVSSYEMDEAVELLRGEVGSTVSLGMKRGKERWNVVIIRGLIKIPPFEMQLIRSVLFITVFKFQKDLSRELKKALDEYAVKSLVSAVVLDLRNNPGGLLKEAIDLADFFLDRGEIVRMEARDGKQKSVKIADRDHDDFLLPLVVIVNSQSASASEIVAATIKENRRGLLIGEQSFGKGTIQRIFDLDEGTALKLTIGEFFGPGRLSIQTRGVMPDILFNPQDIGENLTRIYLDSGERREVGLKNVIQSKAGGRRSGHSIINLVRTTLEDYQQTTNDIAVKLAGNLGHPREILDTLFLEQRRKLETLLAPLKIDWNVDSVPGNAPKVDISLKRDGSSDESVFLIDVAVENDASEALSRYRILCLSAYPNISREFVFGRIKAFERQSKSARITIADLVDAGVIDIHCSEEDIHHAARTVFRGSLPFKIEGPRGIVYSLSSVIDGRSNFIELCILNDETEPLTIALKSADKMIGDFSEHQYLFKFESDRSSCNRFLVTEGAYFWRDPLSFEIVIKDELGRKRIGGKHRIKNERNKKEQTTIFEQPLISFDLPESQSGEDNTWLDLRFSVADKDGIDHLIVFNGLKKHYFSVNDGLHLVKIPLTRGKNYIKIQAEDSKGYTATRFIYIFSGDGPANVQENREEPSGE